MALTHCALISFHSAFSFVRKYQALAASAGASPDGWMLTRTSTILFGNAASWLGQAHTVSAGNGCALPGCALPGCALPHLDQGPAVIDRKAETRGRVHRPHVDAGGRTHGSEAPHLQSVRGPGWAKNASVGWPTFNRGRNRTVITKGARPAHFLPLSTRAEVEVDAHRVIVIGSPPAQAFLALQLSFGAPLTRAALIESL